MHRNRKCILALAGVGLLFLGGGCGTLDSDNSAGKPWAECAQANDSRGVSEGTAALADFGAQVGGALLSGLWNHAASTNK
jgi:hypothetical protein